MTKALKTEETNAMSQLNDIIKLHKKGDIKNAESGYRSLIDVQPDNHGAIYRLGIICMQTERIEEAIQNLTQACRLRPNEVEYLNGLAAAYMKTDKHKEALNILKKILEINPHHAGSHCNIGAVLTKLGNDKSAKNHLEKSIALDSKQSEPLYNLGVIYFKNNKFHDAVDILKKSIELRPDYENAWYRLGDCYKTLAHYRDAEIAYAKVVELNDQSILGWVNLGTMSLMHNKIDKAHECYKKALLIDPSDISTYFHFSYFLNSADLHDDMPALIESAKKHIPDKAITAFMEARLLRRQGHNEKALQILEPHTSATGSEGTKVSYELGLIYDRLDNTDKAFECFTRANELYLQEDTPKVISRDAMFKQLRTIENVLTPQWLETWTPPMENKNYQDPIYLAGFPRSGTTLLDQILNSHPDIFVSPERDALTASIKAVEEKDQKYPHFLTRLNADQVEKMRDNYYEMHKYFGDWEDKPVFIDKIPLVLNFMDLTYRMFPKSKMILSLRHPCDCVLSCYMNEFTPTKSMVLTADLILCAKFYHRTMELFEKFEQLFPTPIYKLRYEDLIVDMEAQVRGVLKFIGLPWDSSVLNYRATAEKKGFISTPSYSQVKKELYTTARYRWLRYYKHLEPVLPILAPWIEKWGYSINEDKNTNSLPLKPWDELNLNKNIKSIKS